MNTPSPLVPQGAQAEPRRKSHLTAVFVILFLHVGALAVLLLQGCKNEEPPKAVTDAGSPPPPTLTDTNLTAPVPPPAPGGLAALPPTPPPPGVPSGALPAGGAGLTTPPAGLTPPPAPGGSLPPPPAPPAPAIPLDPAPTTPSTEHTVVKGDTGAGIAKKYGMGWKAIEAANPGVDARRLKLGQKLIIPAKSVTAAPAAAADAVAAPAGGGASTAGADKYTVKSGDTLAKIAKSHGVTVKALQSANGLKLTSIKVGQKLKIPAKAAAHAAKPAVAAPVPDLPALTPPPSALPTLPPAAPAEAPGLTLPPPPTKP